LPARDPPAPAFQAAGDRFDDWVAAINQVFVPLEVEQAGGDGRPFAGRLVPHDLGALEAGEVESAGLLVTRDRPHLAAAVEAYYVNLQLAGRSGVRQGDDWQPTAPGDLVLVDPNRRFHLGMPTPFRQLSIRIPAPVLEARVPNLPPRAGRVMPVAHPLVRLAATAISETIALDPAARDPAAGPLGDALTELIAAAITGTTDVPVRSADALWTDALAFIERRLPDPDLTPANIAAHLGISTRYVHRIFAAHATTVGRTILRRRLQRAAAALADGVWRDHTITDVALAWGFADAPHFSRTFRAAYGPREWRARGGRPPVARR
jgi:AraC family transcriptional activator of tynA and feaB